MSSNICLPDGGGCSLLMKETETGQYWALVFYLVHFHWADYGRIYSNSMAHCGGSQ